MVSTTSNGSHPTSTNGNGHANGNGHTNGNGSHAVPIVDPTAAHRPTDAIKVNASNVNYSEEFIHSKYTYSSTSVKVVDGKYEVTPSNKEYEFKTGRKVPKTGLMLVGWGGNNGSTLTATVHANRENISWHTKDGIQFPNYIGSMIRASTVKLGIDDTTGKDVNVPFSDLLPMVHPSDFVLGGWDISGMTIDKAMHRAQVLDWDLQRQVAPLIEHYKPLPSIYYPTWINANQDERADNIMAGSTKLEHMNQIRKDIREFKSSNGLDKVIVLWTANTERYAEIIPGVNDTAENILKAVENSHEEIAPSTLFAMASILENAPYINGAPQNTFVPGVIDLAEQKKAFIAGDDFKSGQTKIKSVLAEFLVNAGIKPLSVASYNHLGNNDGANLSAPAQFRSKEVSKSSVIDDLVENNHLLYPTKLGKSEKGGKNGARNSEHPDHTIVIKYMPAVGDSKRAIDEYYSAIMMGGKNIMSIYNLCEDSLLATPLIFDLAILAELMTRIEYKAPGAEKFESMYSVLSLLSIMLKAPVVKPGTDVFNGFAKQRSALISFLLACNGLPMENSLELDRKLTW